MTLETQEISASCPEPCALYPAPRLKYICGKCGSDQIVTDWDHIPGIGREEYKKCRSCGSRGVRERKMEEGSGKMEAHEPPPPVSDNAIEATPKEDTMPIEKLKCRICNKKLRVADQLCSLCFKTVHGFPIYEYKNRLKAGETKEQILQNPKGTARGMKQTLPEPKQVWPETDAVQDETKASYTATKPPRIAAGVIMIDFTNHPDLLDKLREIAEDDFRTPEKQIMYFIKTLYEIKFRVEA